MPSILSVGIDIGTTTTQVVFSRIAMENTAGYFSVPRVSIVDKEVIYKSPIHLTPLRGTASLDGDAIRQLVSEEFRHAGFNPADVDTGAVIITGESARKENAELVLEKLSDFAGEFVVSTAGPDLESVIAGKGSGAYQYSVDNDCITANLDVGGGTTNIVLFNGEDVIGKGCFDIGGRLIRLDRDYVVRSVSASAALIARSVAVDLQPGQRVSPAALGKITDKMADLLAQALGMAPAEPLLQEVRTPGSSSLGPVRHIDCICFSGGVADCMWEDTQECNPLRYGDIGVFLGRAIRKNPHLFSDKFLLRGTETIRATVVGAGTYTTTLSGSTISYCGDVFPLKNIPAMKLDLREQQRCFDDPGVLFDHATWFLDQCGTNRMLLALPGKRDPSYAELKSMARSLAVGLDRALPAGEPVLIAVEQDIAKALGNAVRAELGRKRSVVSIDGIHVNSNDYVDIGRPLMDGLVVPVVIKTLLFG